ncbi:MAG: lipoyl(octanoyl) transferase LipB [Bowdeniella nasicola]|nr:lipoyl(octanoyl) transferase LipB [Bowdeniella nasicola]
MRRVCLIAEGPQPYDAVDALQRSLHAAIARHCQDDCVVVVEMEPVYTGGRRTAPWDVRDPHLNYVPVDRGGRITWHGPGQVVAYPIIALREPLDVLAYVHALEEAVIATLAHYGLEGTRVSSRSGVWLTPPDRKICAVGVRVARGATLHGIALNVNNSLAPYRAIVPCGIADAGVTTMAHELGYDLDLADVADHLTNHLAVALHPLRARRETPDKEPA